MDMEFVLMIVGAGGTGGNFAKEFARYMASFYKRGRSIKAVLIDGDRIEKKNVDRQPFLKEDLNQSKAEILTEAIQENFELRDFKCYPHYITTPEQLKGLFSDIKCNDGDTVCIPVIIGCVDNHRARQCMHEFFESEETCIYVDSANEFSVGEVVIGIRLDGREIAPDRCFYYPDVLTDDSPSAEEQSCGVVNMEKPQHLATNLQAANILLSVIVNIVSENILKGGIIYFDREKYFSRFQPYEDAMKNTKMEEDTGFEKGRKEKEKSSV